MEKTDSDFIRENIEIAARSDLVIMIANEMKLIKEKIKEPKYPDKPERLSLKREDVSEGVLKEFKEFVDDKKGDKTVDEGRRLADLLKSWRRPLKRK